MYTQLSLFGPKPSSPPSQLTALAPTPPKAGRQEAGAYTLNAAIEEYIEHLKRREDISAETRYAQTNDLGKLGAILGMSRPARGLVKADVEALVETLKSAGEAPATVRRRMSTMNAFTAWLLQKGILTVSLKVSVPKPDRGILDVLDDDQVEALCQATASDTRLAFLVRLAFLARLLLAAGLKQKEVVALRVEDMALDSDPPYVQVGRGRSQRKVGLPASLAGYYAAYRREHALVDRVFPVSGRWLNKQMEEISAGLGALVNFTTLRWTCACRDLRAGKPPDRLRRKLNMSLDYWPEALGRLQRTLAVL